MNKVEKIKAEIERLKNELSNNKERLSLGEIIAVNNCYNNLIFFIDSLSDTEKDFGIKSNDLEEASRNYADNEEYGYNVYFTIKAAFKAGAQWQKQQAVKWLKENKNHPFIKCEDPCLSGYLTDEFIEEFKKQWRNKL